ncbi:MAG: GH3 auxin-responsive promoter family protein [Oscillospiraceae bacterium]|nr:GH3 auxin-responsive promoter family protein [Oscillospiraceae bacterium]
MDLSTLSVEEINKLSAQQGAKALQKLREESLDPMTINEQLLMTLLRDNADTEIGRKYDFASIHSIAEYQKRVPVSTYDDYADYVYRMLYNDETNLMTAYDVQLYTSTNGTMGNPKIVPMTDKAIAVQNFYNAQVHSGVINEGVTDYSGHFLSLLECRFIETKGGKNFGHLSSIMLQDSAPIMQHITSTPMEALFPQGDTNARYLQARFGLATADITSINCSFLSIAVELLRYIETEWEMLVDDIEHGTINEDIRMPEEVREKLLERIEPMPERAKELREIFQQGFDEPFAPKVWKKLRLICGVGTGPFEIYDSKLKERFVNDQVHFFYAGISSTEAMFSVPVSLDSKDSALVPNSVFYEFLPMDANGDFSQVVTMDKVEVGKEYEIIMTSPSGLYRYRMGDCIRIMGMYNKLPLIRMQYRIGNMVEIIDDHTTEDMLTAAVVDTAKKFHFDLVDFTVYADRDAMPPRYVYLLEMGDHPDGLKLEEMRQYLDERLCTYSPDLKEYQEKGIGGQTGLHILQEETYLLYKDIMVMKGRSFSQVKPVHIIRNNFQYRFFFSLIDRAWEEADDE